MIFCLHNWGDVKDGYQYCTKCNKARIIKCSHTLKTIRTYNIFNRRDELVGEGYVLQCTKCGVIEKDDTL